MEAWTEPAIASADILVLGGGVAGHRAAIAACERGASVLMAYLAKGASAFLLGCNAPLADVDPADTPEAYLDDMVRGGYGLNDRRLVRVLADEATRGVQELAAAGVPFARDGERFRQRHLSGNTYPRSVFVEAGTGRAILEAVSARVRALGVEVLAGVRGLALLQDKGEVCGAVLLDRARRSLIVVRARAVVLATGGIGRLYGDTTYPADVVSDTFGLALDTGATLIDMEFVQFEPTIVVHPEGCRGMEMPTAMLGDGAHLLNRDGERFMFAYNPEHGEKRVEKARLSLCIQAEIDAGHGFDDDTVEFDATVLRPDLLEGYVTHCARLRKAGLDPAHQRPRVRPAAHSLMGGISIDASGWTGVPGLFAGGEAAGGVHGASRLAGNGGADTIVFGAVAGRGAVAGLLQDARRDWPRLEAAAVDPLRRLVGHSTGPPLAEIVAWVRGLMDDVAGLYRTGVKLEAALDALAGLPIDAQEGLGGDDLAGAVKALEAATMVRSAECVLRAAQLREESRGPHQRRDYPAQDDERWLCHVALRAAGSRSLVWEIMPIR